MSAPQFSKKYYVFLILFLGMLSAFGPFVTDMYLPALPSMTEIFHTTPSLVQMGLSASMLGLAAGQVFFGPLSDKYGRRSVLMFAMVIFCFSTIASIYSPTIRFFNVCRFIQGLGGAGGIVLSRSISTDCYSGRELARTLAIIGAVNGVAPVTAPMIGGLVSGSVGWQGIFWILLALGILLFIMSLGFSESLPVDRRHRGSVLSLLRNYPVLFRNRTFMVFVALFGFANGVLFSYISSASFIVQEHYGFSEFMFAIIFGVNALAIAFGSAIALKFKRLIDAAVVGASGLLIVSSSLRLCILWFDAFWLYESLTFLELLCAGFIFTSTSTLAMDAGRKYIGAASAVFGATGFLFGGIVSPLVGFGKILHTAVSITTVCSFAAFVIALVARRHIRG